MVVDDDESGKVRVPGTREFLRLEGGRGEEDGGSCGMGAEARHLAGGSTTLDCGYVTARESRNVAWKRY